ncbi:hypothetical protein GCM10027605_13390 [Micromonospora zhanjiangensis]
MAVPGGAQRTERAGQLGRWGEIGLCHPTDAISPPLRAPINSPARRGPGAGPGSRRFVRIECHGNDTQRAQTHRTRPSPTAAFHNVRDMFYNMG